MESKKIQFKNRRGQRLTAYLDLPPGSGIRFYGPLDDEQKNRLLEIADRCPVHRTLSSEIKIRTVMEQ